MKSTTKTMLTLTNFKRRMVFEAMEKGIYENFGQQEIQRLKDKYGYNPYGTEKERQIARDIYELDQWVMNLDLQELRLYRKKGGDQDE